MAGWGGGKGLPKRSDHTMKPLSPADIRRQESYNKNQAAEKMFRDEVNRPRPNVKEEKTNRHRVFSLGVKTNYNGGLL